MDERKEALKRVTKASASAVVRFYIANDLKLENVRVLGRNWQRCYSDSQFVRVATRFVDPLIRFNPSLCADIYVVGSKA